MKVLMGQGLTRKYGERIEKLGYQVIGYDEKNPNEKSDYGENQMDFWRCACGFINENETSECEFCGRNKSFVLNNLTEPLINSKILNVIENTRTTDGINLKTLETHLTQTNLSKIAPTTESLKFNRTNEEAPKKPRSIPWKKIYKTLVFLIILSIV